MSRDPHRLPPAGRSLGLVFFPAYDWAISPTHPEREERLLYTQDQLREEGLFDIPGISEHKPGLAESEDVQRVHFTPPGLERVTDTAHYVSAGSAITAADLVLSGLTDRAFALTRPPGHHAMRVVQGGRGFCNVNIEAIMIERLRRDHGIRRVAIVDTDCHHGDGSQDIYWHDPDTLFISIHQDGRTLYPGSGAVDELGGPKARGSTVNIPLPPDTGDEGFLLAARRIIRPLLDEWKPELIVNSAGQDNHFTDPIAHMRLSARGYGRLMDCIDPHLAVLEGGYSIQGALPYVNLAIILAMAGLDYSQVIEPRWQDSMSSTEPRILDYIGRLAEKVLHLHRHPDRADHGYVRERGFWVRERSIFYDTDGISEKQREELYDCPQCPGFLVIHTSSGKRGRSLAVESPRAACSACRQKAEDIYRRTVAEGSPAEFGDRAADRYERNF
ncbi:MAG: histone deacetylase [Desulfovibrio sp.]|jgi:acetoin utilization deacetylase AcuC-like enzyme|nr:histone deacetylase [Desulfovibrio sp.]